MISVRHSLLLLPLAFVACGGSTPSRAEVVGAMTNEQIPAAYAELATDAEELSAATEAFCADPTDPSDVLARVATVRTSWAELRPFWFGPAMDRRTQSYINNPANEDDVADLLAGDTPVDATSLRELVGADQRGLGAVELLAPGPVDERACAYLMGAAELVAAETAALADEWATYGPTLATDDEAANATLNELVSETIFALPLTSSDNPMAAGQLAGARFALLGDDSSEGIAPLLDDTVVEQLEADFAALAANPGFDTEMALEQTIKTNVVGDLGLSVKFSDADGDG